VNVVGDTLKTNIARETDAVLLLTAQRTMHRRAREGHDIAKLEVAGEGDGAIASSSGL
jgi:hypothetical protein